MFGVLARARRSRRFMYASRMDYLVPPERCQTTELVLRSFMPGDGNAMREATVASYEHLAPWMPWAQPAQSEEEAERIVRGFRAKWLLAEDFAVAVFAADEKTLLGGCGFHLREGSLAGRCAEMGMWIRSSHAGRGLGTRVLTTLLAWGFTEWPWLRLSWRCDARNAASIRIAEKAGMVLEGVLRGQPAVVGEGRRDTMCFALLRDDWCARTAAR
jgi:RimJ/RimL family protein N-acetyltransferase